MMFLWAYEHKTIDLKDETRIYAENTFYFKKMRPVTWDVVINVENIGYILLGHMVLSKAFMIYNEF